MSCAVQTTLVALLQRLYDPAGGCILIDGVDLRELDAGWYRSQLGVVQQVRGGQTTRGTM
jgi:ABC-type multidrug transport system fused ATPase/permease subunit